MYPNKRRNAGRGLLRRFVISCEGGVTERDYFDRLRSLVWNMASLEVLTDKNHASPGHVLDRIKAYDKRLSPGDELWCVVDMDDWTDAQRAELFAWASQDSDGIFRGVAISNPKFEIWLLAHFQSLPPEGGYYRLLSQYLPSYDKTIDKSRFTLQNIEQAIMNAHLLYASDDPPLQQHGTNVATLVDHILHGRQ